MNTKGRIFKFFCLKNQTFQFLVWWSRGVIRFITNGVIFGRVLLQPYLSYRRLQFLPEQDSDENPVSRATKSSDFSVHK